jgi:hypothetical protein
MSEKTMRETLLRMATDDDFRRSVQGDAAALAGLDLTADEIEQLRSLTEDDAAPGVQPMAERISKSGFGGLMTGVGGVGGAAHAASHESAGTMPFIAHLQETAPPSDHAGAPAGLLGIYDHAAAQPGTSSAEHGATAAPVPLTEHGATAAPVPLTEHGATAAPVPLAEHSDTSGYKGPYTQPGDPQTAASGGAEAQPVAAAPSSPAEDTGVITFLAPSPGEDKGGVITFLTPSPDE